MILKSEISPMKIRKALNTRKAVQWGLWVLLAGCQGAPESAREKPLFSKVTREESGVDFNNAIQPFENDTLHALSYDPLFNGAGVGVGDFNGDGLADLFFAGNLVSSRLYLNRGGFRFEDVTAAAGLTTRKWCAGVCVADVDQDGRPDLYLSVAGPDSSAAGRANLLFLNEGVDAGSGVPRFREMAAACGLDDTGFSTQAAFFDYDRDGDLDCYVLTNAIERTGRNTIRPKRLRGEGPSTDRLYRNVGRRDGHPVFENVSRQAGIVKEGYGLGLCIADVDQDGWDDIYCANDFLSNDLLWINNRDGTFTDRAADYFKHTSFNSMGVDVADFNNDARPDVCVVDMLPEPNERRKMMLIKTNWDFFRLAREQGYQDEYVRNTLQLNRGTAGDRVYFSEIGQLAGIFATDWSWAPLLADFDNDGYKDLLVSNGYRRDITNLDFVVYLNETVQMRGNEFSPETRKQVLEQLYKLPEIKLHNYIFRNRGDLTFEDKSAAWGLEEKTYSNGAAYADLDNDGDLDLVFNNIDDAAGIYRNNWKQAETAQGHFLRLRLFNGPGGNQAIGASVRVHLPGRPGEILYQENQPVRGYLSSVEPVLHFGLGKNSSAATVEITWAGGEIQRLEHLPVDTLFQITYDPRAIAGRAPQAVDRGPSYFSPLDTSATGIGFRHVETPFDEFRRTFILPHVFSRSSPGLAVADADGNGLDDVFFGADPGQVRSLYLQERPGKFRRLVQGANDLEDMGSIFLDADGDGDQDLYVVSGGSQVTGEHAAYQDRLYFNDGSGRLTRGQGVLPDIRSSGSVAVAADFDRDGDLDIFRGGRVAPGQYPTLPRSFLLRNDGGRFTDATAALCPELENPGMVTAALWTDFDADGFMDLMLAGEFMPIRLFRNRAGKGLEEANPSGLKNSEGWWNSLASADFDRDGDMDYLAGNLGRNHKFAVSRETPLALYAADFDRNGSIDPILTYYLHGEEQVSAIRDALNEQMPVLMKKRFTSYTAFARADFKDVLTPQERREAQVLKAYELQSCWIENLGSGNFALRPLPVAAQFSPVYGMVAGDFNYDGYTDALLAGNSHASETYSGWYDASLGTLLAGDGTGKFFVVPFAESGFQADRDAKALGLVFTGTEQLVMVTNNNSAVQLFKPNTPPERFLPIPAAAAWAIAAFPDGKSQRFEFTVGSGYLSQSSRVLAWPKGATGIDLFDYQGRKIDLSF
jgi:hypothetical protein